MPIFPGMYGFEARDGDRDRIIVLAGAALYETADLPTGSSSETAIGNNGLHFRAPWYEDSGGGFLTCSTTEFWYHFRLNTSSNGAFNNTLIVGVADGGSEYLSVGAENSTNKLVIRVGGVVRATAASAAFSVGIYERIHVHISGKTAGSVVSVYMDGDLDTAVVDYTLVAGDATALSALTPNEFLVHCKSTPLDLIDDLVVIDPAAPGFPGMNFLLEPSIKPQLFTGNGAEQDWTGDYTDIDELPADDADKIIAQAIGDQSTFTHAAIAEDNVFAVKMLARVTRTGTIAGAHLRLQALAGVDLAVSTVPAPGDGDVQVIFEEAPDGLAWTPTKYDAARFGFQADT